MLWVLIRSASVLEENICCGYSLEVPHLTEALLMSTHNICFPREIRKIICGYPLLSVAMFKFLGPHYFLTLSPILFWLDDTYHSKILGSSKVRFAS